MEEEQQPSYLPEVTRIQSASDTWVSSTEDEENPSHGVTHDIPSKPGEAETQSYMANILSKAKPSISNMSSLLRTKKKDEDENKEDQRPLSQSSLDESVMSKGSTAKSFMSS